MKLVATILSFFCLAVSAGAAETVVKSKVDSVGLFKNGLAVVKRSVKIDGNGTYRIENVPTPVHGTFWLESNAKVETRVTSREIDVPIRPANAGDFQNELVGRSVNVYFRDGRIPPAQGKVVRITKADGDDAWNRNYANNYSRGGGRPATNRQFMVLQTKNGFSYVNSAMIAYVQTTGSKATVKKRVPVLLLKVTAAPKQARIQISYLAKGMAWAPSYRIDISDPKKLTIEQKAVIKNELGVIDNAEIRLISGFPGVHFSNVTSPLSHRTSWSNFFTQLNRRSSSNAASISNNVLSQQAVAFNSVGPRGSTDLSAAPAGEGVDLHFQSIGRRSLAEGDSLALSVGKSSAKYNRIVEWIIPDTRGVYGQYMQAYRLRQQAEKLQDSAWDAIQFKNPLPFPMTTAAAMIVSKGRFNGQNISYFVNTGEKTTLRITKALSIRTRHIENEEKGNRNVIYVGGRRFRDVKVKGELRASNHRREVVTLVIRRRFSGELIESSGNPTSDLLEEGAYSVNKRNELLWKVTLKSGEEKKLTYRYSVLVNH